MPGKKKPAPLSGTWRYSTTHHDGWLEEIDPLDANLDITVDLQDGRSYALTLYTVENLRTLMRGWREKREPPYGLYFRGVDAIVLERLTRSDVDAAVAELLRSGEIESAGTLLPPAGAPGA